MGTLKPTPAVLGVPFCRIVIGAPLRGVRTFELSPLEQRTLAAILARCPFTDFPSLRKSEDLLEALAPDWYEASQEGIGLEPEDKRYPR